MIDALLAIEPRERFQTSERAAPGSVCNESDGPRRERNNRLSSAEADVRCGEKGGVEGEGREVRAAGQVSSLLLLVHSSNLMNGLMTLSLALSCDDS